jgi:hypothetical protein
MKTLDKLSLLSLVVVASAAFAACDVDDDDDADGGGGAGGNVGGMGGNVGGEGGNAGGAGGSGTGEFNVVYIIDTSMEENPSGTPGSDICGVSAECSGTDLDPQAVELVAGAGDVCVQGQSVGGSACSADRGNADAARDNGATCEAASAPSDYVSIGVNGSLAVTFGQDLRGCSVQVVENNQGATPEGYDVFICADTAGTNCINSAAIESAPNGGNVSFDVPNE